MDSKELCDYGCGQEGKYYLSYAKKWCCSKSWNSCPVIRKKFKGAKIGRKRGPFSKKHKDNLSLSIKQSWKDPNSKYDAEKYKIEMSKKRSGKDPWNKGRIGVQTSTRKGKTYEEIYGEEKAREISEKKSNKKIEEWKDPNSKVNSKKYRKLLSKIMKDGKAAYAASFIKDDSKPENELFYMSCKILPRPIHKYPVYRIGKGKRSYNVDIADPSMGIILEFDGWYHFDTPERKEYDKKRQKEIEEEGWKFLRYNIFQKFPTLEQLKEDIKIAVGNISCQKELNQN